MAEQATLSKFFRPAPSLPAASTSASRVAPIVIDGSSDSEEVEDVKPVASTSKRTLSFTTRSSEASAARKRPKVTGDMASWYFNPSHSSSATAPSSNVSPERQRKCRTKFLGRSNRAMGGYMDQDSAFTPQSSTARHGKQHSSELERYRRMKKHGTKFTPLEEQWLGFKSDNPDAVLLLQSGYKFKFFGDDAVEASKLLNIAHFQEKNLMAAMIPDYRLPIHIKRLLQAGHKVGVIRQVETAALKKVGDNKSGLFERKLTDLYTLATWVDDLDTNDQAAFGAGAGEAGSICCLFERSEGKRKGTDELVKICLAAFQPATGQLIHDVFEDGFIRSNLESRLLHLKPTEVLLATEVSKGTESAIKLTLTPLLSAPLRMDRFTPYTYENAVTALRTSLENNGRAMSKFEELDRDMIITLAGFARELSKFGLGSVFGKAHFRQFAESATMALKANTLVNLEIFNNSFDHREYGSLFWLLDRCKTAFGKRRLRSWIARPLTSLPDLCARQDCVQEIIDADSYRTTKLSNLLGSLPDLEKGMARVYCGRIKAPELLRLLLSFKRVSSDFSPNEIQGFKSPVLRTALESLPTIKDSVDHFLSMLDRSAAKQGKEGKKEDLFGDSYEEIVDAKDRVSMVEVELAEELKNIRKILKKPTAAYISVVAEEYLVEVRISESSKLVPSDWIKVNQTKHQNRYRSPKVSALVEELEQARESLAAVSEQCYQSFLNDISEEGELLGDVVRRLSEVDCLFALATTSSRSGYCRPEFVAKAGYISIQDGRHPVVEEVLDHPHVPNDVNFPGADASLQTLILTGLNMGGKSTFSRMVGCIVILAQIGCWVPAQACTTSVFDGIHTRMGATDELSRNRSTFMVELAETSEILKCATKKSLCILDELGRGTSTTDGLSIALAVLQRLADVGCVNIFITHYAQLLLQKELEDKAVSAHMSYVEDEHARPGDLPDVHFLYKLQIGASGKSHGLNVARLAGLPRSVIERAQLKANQLENTMRQRALRNRTRRLLQSLTAEGGVVSRGVELEAQLVQELIESSTPQM